MRILHVIDTLDFGGAEKVMVALANGFTSEHEVSVCCLSHVGELARELDPQISVWSMGRGPGTSLLLPWRLAQRLRAGRFDVIHTHNWSVFLEAGIAAWLARVPVAIHTVHGPYVSRGPGLGQRVKRALRHALERIVARRFQRVVAVSDSIREYIPTTVGIEPQHLSTVHNGVGGDAPPIHHAHQTITFITVGRLDAIKNHELMLRAFSLVLARHPSARLVLVGDGPQRAALEALIDELGVRAQVDLPGFRTDVGELLSSADVFLMSSRYEGISIALLESMRAGLPAVATRVGGIPETVLPERTGLLVESGDTEAFAQAMLRLASSAELRRDFGTAARAFQQREFSLEVMLARYGALYANPQPTP